MQTELRLLFKQMKIESIPKYYKKNAILFLDGLYHYEAFLTAYHEALTQVVKNLKVDMRRLDYKFEKQFTRHRVLYERALKEEPENDRKIHLLEKDVLDSKTKLLCHRWMKKKFDKYRITIVEKPDELFQEFKKHEAMNAYNLYKEGRASFMQGYLENEIIDFYYKKSLPEIHPDKLQLNYITRL